ncbi:PucR family transcriptional regulator [Streptacidiphilus carbonis]|uniref:PucR family transcriptional regulator n=1 Tax=Streptacidiphilus carbonis TaxID=105422 RepID=UPI0012699698|nr:PucR family transcriptional regulator [Streptacidiphilus carbonis]
MSTATHHSSGFSPQRAASARPARPASILGHRDRLPAPPGPGNQGPAHQGEAPRTVPHDAPWVALPPGFARLVRGENPRLVTEIVEQICRQIPEYAQLFDMDSGAALHRATARVLNHFADLIAGDRSSGAATATVHRALGRGECRAGRGLDLLQAAYRLAARLVWRRYAMVARHTGVSMGTLALLAEVIFAYADQIVVAATAGYAQAQADEPGTQRYLRQKLLKSLLAGEPAYLVAEAARAAGWRLPNTLSAVVLLRPGASDPLSDRAPLGAAGTAELRRRPDVLAQLEGPEPFLLLPEPHAPGARERLARLLGDQPAVVGPSVPWTDAAESLRWARTVAERQPGTVLANTAGPTYCDEDLTAVLLLGDQALVGLVSERRLAPLGSLTPNRRHHLEATLLAWLEASSGSAPEVAASLGLHPQTVRQRMRRLEKLFGGALTDPRTRFEIDLALRGRLLKEAEAARTADLPADGPR